MCGTWAHTKRYPSFQHLSLSVSTLDLNVVLIIILATSAVHHCQFLLAVLLQTDLQKTIVTHSSNENNDAILLCGNF